MKFSGKVSTSHSEFLLLSVSSSLNKSFLRLHMDNNTTEASQPQESEQKVARTCSSLPQIDPTTTEPSQAESETPSHGQSMWSMDAAALKERGAVLRERILRHRHPLFKDPPKRSDEKKPESPSSTTDPSTFFDCHICLDIASDPVVTRCGHLFCWPCLHQWMQSDRSAARTCPVCKSAVDTNQCIPIYARGRPPSDPRCSTSSSSSAPPRPSAQFTSSPASTHSPAAQTTFGFGPFFFYYSHTTETGARGSMGNELGQGLMILGLLMVLWIILGF